MNELQRSLGLPLGQHPPVYFVLTFCLTPSLFSARHVLDSSTATALDRDWPIQSPLSKTWPHLSKPHQLRRSDHLRCSFSQYPMFQLTH